MHSPKNMYKVTEKVKTKSKRRSSEHYPKSHIATPPTHNEARILLECDTPTESNKSVGKSDGADVGSSEGSIVGLSVGVSVGKGVLGEAVGCRETSSCKVCVSRQKITNSALETINRFSLQQISTENVMDYLLELHLTKVRRLAVN